MKILITGATGFVGQALIPLLLQRGHTLICVSRSADSARLMDWYEDVEFIFFDIEGNEKFVCVGADALIHLAWNDLSNYRSLIHIDKHLPKHITFLKAVVESGISQILIAGTCLEYGMKNGELFEDDHCDPHLPYAIAKDTLRKYMVSLKAEFKFTLQWIRLFYLFGDHQSERSLLSQLDAAINNGDDAFNMSKGDQLRDFITISVAANYFVRIIENRGFDGILNFSTGNPISVRTLVESRINESNANMKLNLGFYPYPDYEPMAFWGSHKKLSRVISHRN